MASHDTGQVAGTEAYEQGWLELTRALDSGSSWSGRERNVAYLNLGEGRFADISSISGLDLDHDGRSVLQVDWDHDGALDLLLRSRTGPQLRLMANRKKAGDRWVSLQLQGTTSNPDAVGAQITLTVALPAQGTTKVVREVTAGDGYLSQSSLRQHLALGQGEELAGVEVRWPGGELEAFEGVIQGAHSLVVEGSGRAQAMELPRHDLKSMPSNSAQPAPGRVVLRTPFPVPPTTRRALGAGAGRAALLNLWSADCAPCLSELAELASSHSTLQELGLDVLPLCVDTGDDAVRAQELFTERISPPGSPAPLVSKVLDPQVTSTIHAILAHALGPDEEGLLPTSLLVDEKGWLQVIYIGPLEVEQLLADARVYAPGPRGAEARGTWAGRWFFGTPRNLSGLSQDLAKRGLPQEARFYDLFNRRAPR